MVWTTKVEPRAMVRSFKLLCLHYLTNFTIGEPQPPISSQSSPRSHSQSTHSKQPRRVNSTLSSEISSPTTPSVGYNLPGFNKAPPVPRVPSKYNPTVVDPLYHEHSADPPRGRPPAPPFANASRAASLPSPRGDEGGFLRDSGTDTQSSSYSNYNERR